MRNECYLSGFAHKETKATLVCFCDGIHIIYGTVGDFWKDIISEKIIAPFVFETDDGDMAAGGIFCTSREWVRQCVIDMIVTGVMRNHEKGMQSSVVPVFSDDKPNKLLTVSAIPASSERRNDLDDYAKLEVFLSEWLDGYPGMFV